MASSYQIQLFDTVSSVYADSDKAMSTAELYERVASNMSLSDEAREATGLTKGKRFNIFHRDCRWAQQRLKAKGLLERVDRGMWRLTGKGRETLTEMGEGYLCLGFSTRLGICIWGDARLAGEKLIEDDVHLILTSPPYLNVDRNYGTHTNERAYVEFVVSTLEPYIVRMAAGAGLVINIGNDIFVRGRAERSVCVERLVLALHDDLNLALVERIPWVTNKCPGPTQWAFVQRFMLRSGWEITLSFTNNPEKLRWDNRRVLQDHDPDYLEWCQSGGQRTDWQNNTYGKKAGAFSGTKEKRSKIPVNVLRTATTCREMRVVKAFAREHGLPEHTACFPVFFAEFFIKWMTREGDLVVDPFGGTQTTGSAAEKLGRKWFGVDKMLEFIQAAPVRFEGTQRNPNLLWPGAG